MLSTLVGKTLTKIDPVALEEQGDLFSNIDPNDYLSADDYKNYIAPALFDTYTTVKDAANDGELTERASRNLPDDVKERLKENILLASLFAEVKKLVEDNMP